MSSTPPINRFLFIFFTLLVLTVGVAAIIWPGVRGLAYAPLRDVLFPNLFLPTRAGQPVSLLIAAPPKLAAWVKTSADDFSRLNPLTQIAVVQMNGMDADRRLNSITSQPDVWIAEADFVRISAGGLPFDANGTTVAQDGFLWVVTKGQSGLSGPIGWKILSQTVHNSPQFKIALPPTGSVEGMAACWVAAAEYYQQNSMNAGQINDPSFQSFLKGLVEAAPDRNHRPLDELATRPPQVALGLIQQSDWSQLPQDLFNKQAPDINMAFNFPYLIRSTWQEIQPDEADARRAAAVKFRDYLLSGSPQGKLAGYGLSPANTHLAGQIPLTDEAAIRAVRFCWQ